MQSMGGPAQELGAHTPDPSTQRRPPSIRSFPTRPWAPWVTFSLNPPRPQGFQHVLPQRYQRNVRSHSFIQYPRPNTGRKTGSSPYLFSIVLLEIANLSPVLTFLSFPPPFFLPPTFHPHCAHHRIVPPRISQLDMRLCLRFCRRATT